jgi:hypothetical protein
VTAIRLSPRSNNFCLRNHNIFIGGQIIQRVARTGRDVKLTAVSSWQVISGHLSKTPVLPCRSVLDARS